MGRPKRTYTSDSAFNNCTLWPDKQLEKAADIKVIGTTIHKLTYIQPVYFFHYAWFFLAICECGKEIILRPGRAKSCGCLKKKPTVNTESVRFKAKFDRTKHCIHLPYVCEHYSECLKERVFLGKNSRYKPSGCYCMTDKEKALYVAKT